MIRKWNRGCRRWRKICIRRLAQKYQRAQNIRRFRTCLAAALCLEVLAGATLFWNQNRPELNLVRREEICEVELIPKTDTDDETAKEQDIYGIRLEWKALEVQFYHRKDAVH